eukprot:5154766-Pyramimonas_sp.AAC.1
MLAMDRSTTPFESPVFRDMLTQKGFSDNSEMAELSKDIDPDGHLKDPEERGVGVLAGAAPAAGDDSKDGPR